MTIPTEWTFKNADVASGFDRHVREQLPWYDLMSGAVAHIARHYIPQGGTVLDLGCSTGHMGNLLRETLDARGCRFVPVDNSPEMLAKYSGPGVPMLADMVDFDFPAFDVAILFLSLMFVPPGHRSSLIRRLRSNCLSGGVILVVDKEVSRGGYLGTALSRLTLAGKVASGVPSSEIVAKELSLMGVQRPILVDDLGRCTEIFRFGEFAGWAIEG